MTESVLIVDDEPPVRKTFQEWLESANLDCRILSAADAESALKHANQTLIDLAILDWNLGAGNDGLHLLEDLYVFNPDVVAILVTGYAHQATPLDAMRMGVRDYLDKNQDLDRETFVKAVKRQLEWLRPAKRERQLHQKLLAFREAVDKVLPLVQSAAALHDPVPLPEAIRGLYRFLLRTTGARDGAMVVRGYDSQRQPAEHYRAYDAGGAELAGELVPFAQSIAGSAVSLQQPAAMTRLEATAVGDLKLQPFERGRHSLLAVPMAIGPGTQVVLELFDKQRADGKLEESGFSEADHRLVATAADLGAEIIRHALGERQTHQVLLDAMAAALEASDTVAETLRGAATPRRDEPPPDAIMDRLREGLRATGAPAGDADDTLRLIEAIRVLAVRHGPSAVRHCTRLVESVRDLLDGVTAS
jgi:ActR/RegA family two-component response regulator